MAEQMQYATEFDSCYGCGNDIEPGQAVRDSSVARHPFVCIPCSTPTPPEIPAGERTPGKWVVHVDGQGESWIVVEGFQHTRRIAFVCTGPADYGKANGEYLAAVLDAAPGLIEALADRDARIAELEAELAPHREEVERQKRWAAYLRQSDVRCLTCDLRYEERDQYRCEYSKGGGHRYDEDELADALAGTEDEQ